MRNKAIIVNDSLCVENFSEAYPFLNKYVLENGEIESSRNGSTKEILDFKTKLTNPHKRCVGNNSRNINIFFLMAEAMWIYAGRKDVKTLSLFNEQMSEYSDDGEFFHAPYGFRLRHFGVSSFDKIKPSSPENNGHEVNQLLEGTDQLYDSILALNEDNQSRRVVMSIWNPNLDLNKKSKDLPCNDMVFLKIRNGKLITTIANRSNDLHWGLPTNIFQFSFVSEMISLILGIELGTQTHNSQSLHIYTDNDIAIKMYENLQFNNEFEDLYDISTETKIDFNFGSKDVQVRISELDQIINQILDSFLSDGYDDNLFLKIQEKSKVLAKMYHLCHIYLNYKKSDKTDKNRVLAIEKIFISSLGEKETSDIFVLAQNFFSHRIKDQANLKSCSKVLFTKEKL